MVTKKKMNAVAAQNPNVDKKQLAETLRTMQELERLGVHPVGYNLTPPFANTIRCEKKAKS